MNVLLYFAQVVEDQVVREMGKHAMQARRTQLETMRSPGMSRVITSVLGQN